MKHAAARVRHASSLRGGELNTRQQRGPRHRQEKEGETANVASSTCVREATNNVISDRAHLTTFLREAPVPFFPRHLRRAFSVWKKMGIMNYFRDVECMEDPRKTMTLSYDRIALAQLLCRACALWWMLFLLIGGTHWGRSFFGSDGDDASVSLAINGVALPLLLASTLAAWALRTNTTTPAANDPDYNRLGLCCIVLPSLIFVVSASYRHYQNTSGEWPLQLAALHVGNALGMVALLALSVLLVPVTRQGPLLRVLGWNPAAAVQLHIWMGRVVVMGVVGHGVLHLLRWKIVQGEALSTVLLPPLACFSWVKDDAEESLTHCENETTQCRCHHLLRNLSGLIGALALLALFGASLIRRRWYKVFYHIHIIAGPTILIATILHWKRSMLYLAAGALYYTACTAAIYMKRSCPVQVNQVERIGSDSSPCLAITVAASSQAMQSYRSGQYAQVTVPALSTTISHPFTISRTRNPNELRLLLRTAGPWTRSLLQQLEGAQEADDNDSSRTTVSPRLEIQGFYGGDRTTQLLQHDRVVMVAGGIGITPFLSALLQREQRNAAVELHWMCRDPALIDYVRREYLDTAAAASSMVRVVVYPTAPGGSSELSSVIEYRNSAGAHPLPAPSTVSFSTFTVSLWVGIAGVRWLYQLLQASPSEHLFWPRLLSLVWMVAVCVCTAVLLQGSSSSDDDASPQQRPSEVTELLEQGGIASSYSTGATHGSVEIRACGRPDPSELVATLATAERPALWVCGPEGLVKDMRQQATKHSITMYTESFVL